MPQTSLKTLAELNALSRQLVEMQLHFTVLEVHRIHRFIETMKEHYAQNN